MASYEEPDLIRTIIASLYLIILFVILILDWRKKLTRKNFLILIGLLVPGFVYIYIFRNVNICEAYRGNGECMGLVSAYPLSYLFFYCGITSLIFLMARFFFKNKYLRIILFIPSIILIFLSAILCFSIIGSSLTNA